MEDMSLEGMKEKVGVGQEDQEEVGVDQEEVGVGQEDQPQ